MVDKNRGRDRTANIIMSFEAPRGKVNLALFNQKNERSFGGQSEEKEFVQWVTTE